MMSASGSDERWQELRRLVAGAGGAKEKSGLFLGVMFGTSDGIFYDAEGNDRTDMVRTLVERLDQTTRLAQSLAERVAVLERLAVHDEARIALEIEKLRAQGG